MNYSAHTLLARLLAFLKAYNADFDVVLCVMTLSIFFQKWTSKSFCTKAEKDGFSF